MASKQTLEAIGARYFAEPALQAAAIGAAKLPEQHHDEALRRIRAKTRSLMMHDMITNQLEDGFVATPDNSMVQPYEA